MKLASVTTLLSRRAGGLFSSVRELQYHVSMLPGVETVAFGLEDEFAEVDLPYWRPTKIITFPIVGPDTFGYSPSLLPAIRKFEPSILLLHSLWTYPSVAVGLYFKWDGRPGVSRLRQNLQR